MDKNTSIGMALIVAVLIGFYFINQPSEEEMAASRARQDSIAQVEARREQARIAEQQNASFADNTQQTVTNPETGTEKSLDDLQSLYGDFSTAAIGEEKLITLENNLIRVMLSTKGGGIHSVELKNFKRHDSTALILIEPEKVNQNILFSANNRTIATNQLYFNPSINSSVISTSGPEVPQGSEGRLKFNEKNPGGSKELVLKLEVANGGYIEYVYSIKHNSYVVDFDVRMVNLNGVIQTNTGQLPMTLEFDIPRQERPSKFGEDRYTSMNYKYKGAEVDNTSYQKDDVVEQLLTPVKWIGFKQLFFSTVLRADDAFPSAVVDAKKLKDDSEYLGHFKAEVGLDFNNTPSETFNMSIYFGPNHYLTLKEQGEDMEKLINLGWPVVRHVNQWLIIPVFNWLHKHINNFGIIILILTVMIRTIVFPFTYKSYTSQAKMRALKPEIDEINKKFPADKAMDRQQATMALYRKVGVNPMGGCLPMLFQFPFLIAMFYFFPGSIELRQQSFLWATDLSTYDTIMSLPFTVPFGYGNHVSLFTLLMTVTTILQTRLTGQTQDTSAMPGMKYMMYFMPVFFMFILNSYASGLSYYYFLANVFTIGQTYLIRSTIDEDKVREQLQANKKKPAKKKSGFQARLEDMAKKQQQQTKKRK